MRFRAIVCAAALIAAEGQDKPRAAGIWEGHGDVGSVVHPGSVKYDATSKAYTVTGSGENMWFAQDEFHLVWMRVSGDFTLTAEIAFLEAGGNAHKKAVLMARQSLAPDSAYADIAVHGDGLTSLQAREQTGAATHEVGINAAHPRSARLQKHGDYFYMSLSDADGALKFAGGAMRVPLTPPFYVGIGVCAHDKDAVARAVFSNVSMKQGGSADSVERYNTLETMAVASTDRRVVYVDTAPVDAPGWTAAGASLSFESNGSVYRVTPKGPAPERFTPESGATPSPRASESYPASDGFVNCFPRPSPDGLQVAVLSYEQGTTGCPANTEVLLRLITPADQKARVLAKLVGGPGTFGPRPWSPDGKSLVFVSRQAIPR